MSSLAAVRIAVRSGLRVASRQSVSAFPRASVMVRPALLARTFAVSSHRQNKASLTAADSQLAGILNTEIKLEAETDEPAPEVVNDFLKSSGFSVSSILFFIRNIN